MAVSSPNRWAGFLDGRRNDDSLRTGRERPLVGPVVNDLPRLAILVDDDLRHVCFREIPNLPFAEFPAGFRQLVEILQGDGINEILVRAPHKNLVGLRRAEQQLRDDGVGVTTAENKVICRVGVASP